VATAGAFEHLPPYTGALLLGLGLAAVGGLWFRYQIDQLAQASAAPVTVAPATPREAYPGFQSLAQGMWLGAPLFGRESRAYVGRITSLTCPQHPVGVSGVACLEIEFADGRRAWVERSRAETQYLTPRITN
jgi:hypothetical protein